MDSNTSNSGCFCNLTDFAGDLLGFSLFFADVGIVVGSLIGITEREFDKITTIIQ
jgi:hypothetical protein